VNKDNRDAVVISLGDIATITIPPNAVTLTPLSRIRSSKFLSLELLFL
jgi:hypothetical protein